MRISTVQVGSQEYVAISLPDSLPLHDPYVAHGYSIEWASLRIFGFGAIRVNKPEGMRSVINLVDPLLLPKKFYEQIEVIEVFDGEAFQPVAPIVSEGA